jgi:hypothetical protein
MTYAARWKDDNLMPINGYILQGPVSDRESTAALLKKQNRDYEASLAYATRLVEEGKGKDEYMPKNLLPEGYNTPVNAYRWHSLISVGCVCTCFLAQMPFRTADKIRPQW